MQEIRGFLFLIALILFLFFLCQRGCQSGRQWRREFWEHRREQREHRKEEQDDSNRWFQWRRREHQDRKVGSLNKNDVLLESVTCPTMRNKNCQSMIANSFS